MFRLPFAVVCVSFSFLADCAALTLDEISLMLRSGFSSRTIMQEELVGARVYGRFDAEWEKEFIRLHASPALIEAIKSGKYAPPEAEQLAWQKAVREQENTPTAIEIEGKRITKQAAEQQPRAPQTSAIVVVPAQPASIGKLPSEIEAEERAANIAARKEYCEAHPVECASQASKTRKRRVEKDEWQQQTQSVTPDAYGLGVNADEFGRSHTYRTQEGEKLSPIFQGGVKRNAYGLGVHADEFGRAVYDGKP